MKVLAGLWRWPDAKAAIASPFPEGSRWRLETGPPRPGDPRFGPIAASETMKCLRVFSRPDQPPPIRRRLVGWLASLVVVSSQLSVVSPISRRVRGWKRAFGGGDRPPSPSLGSGTPPVPTTFAHPRETPRGTSRRLAHSSPLAARRSSLAVVSSQFSVISPLSRRPEMVRERVEESFWLVGTNPPRPRSARALPPSRRASLVRGETQRSPSWRLARSSQLDEDLSPDP